MYCREDQSLAEETQKEETEEPPIEEPGRPTTAHSFYFF